MELFVPLYDKILVQKDEQESVIAGGFVIPDSAKEKPDSGIILAVGHGRLLENGTTVPLQVKAGDHILFGKWAGTDIKLDGKTYMLMLESEVFGFLPRKKGEAIE